MVLDTRRHIELFDPDSFNTPIHIIGCGATGSWLVLALAKLGIKGELINVYDFDIVEEHNIPNQAFNLFGQDSLGSYTIEHGDIGKQKTDALKDVVFKSTGTDIKTNDKFTNQRLSGIVFLMVDSMKERKRIWRESIRMKPSIKHLIEPRMGLDMGRIYNVNPLDLNQITKYENTYYDDDTAEVSACGTSMTVITSALGIASWCARQLINFHNNEELDNEILVDFKYNNLITTRW